MAKTYGNPHTNAPKQCAANTIAFTDPTLTAHGTKHRKVHIDELRTAVNAELTRRGITNVTFTDSTITARSTKIRKIHIDELRAAIDDGIKEGDCAADSYYCPQDSTAAISWTDPTITEHDTKQKGSHISELRSTLQALMASCICEAEQCQYCQDCGFDFTYYTPSVACDDDQGCGCNYFVHAYRCASINLSSATTYPYKVYTGTCNYPSGCNDCSFGGTITPGDNTVPWNMCNYTPPGSNWGTCEYQGAHDHSAWNCKCNPYTWP